MPIFMQAPATLPLDSGMMFTDAAGLRQARARVACTEAFVCAERTLVNITKGRILRGSARFGRSRRNPMEQRLVASRGQFAVHYFFGTSSAFSPRTRRLRFGRSKRPQARR